MGLFGAAHRWGERAKRHPLLKICHTYPAMRKLGAVIPYLKKSKKIYESCETPLEVCWNQLFFTGKQQILLRKIIQTEIACWYIVSNSFNKFWVFKDLIKMVTILMTSANIPNLGLLKIKVFSKKRLRRHHFCPWRHQPNFITWFKLYCRCGHVTKVW